MARFYGVAGPVRREVPRDHFSPRSARDRHGAVGLHWRRNPRGWTDMRTTQGNEPLGVSSESSSRRDRDEPGAAHLPPLPLRPELHAKCVELLYAQASNAYTSSVVAGLVLKIGRAH